ncbi:uncharacterized protein (TIGR02268 family) [Archangium gephyra]|uniref:Uncharacterized protein (TIGR02268 family) n=1 Tax=Archangium gephyra TaxID=48 RepID=A0AAC8TEB0_9BACT|nr:DUF2381 family protein [Archangium gephyra]AKJ01441.1 Hypothetical protein AA314_03067 [Archangium gephyra]REG34255.1 uncharacterized protein (TIGR02268 family) [Archangium gephyra]
MSTLLTAPLLLVLLTSTPASPRSEEWDTSGARYLELTAENAGEPHPVRISPGQPTTLVFADAPLQPGGVMVEGGAVGMAVNGELGMVTLLPSDAPPADKPLTLVVRFADTQVPGSVTFRLVPHATQAEHHVRVYRNTRSCESHWQESRQQRERAERCEAALAQERTRPEGPRPGDLTDLFDAELVGQGISIRVRDITKGITQRPGEAPQVVKAHSYQADRPRRVALELRVRNTSTRPWTVEGLEAAELVSTEGVRLRVVRVWQSGPLGPGERAWLVVEAEAPAKQTPGSFLLKLGEAGGARPLTVRGVTFP